ncbi:MAG: class I SAM-dependent methyltransferase [Desulfobacteraceae bacterium]
MLTPRKLASISPGTRIRANHVASVLTRLNVTRICDCGCGMGIISTCLQDKGFKTIGFDLHPSLVAHAMENHGLRGRYFVSDIRDLPFTDNCIESIVASDIIEHLESAHEALMEIKRVLEPGGKAVMTIPNPLFETICTLFGLSQKDLGHHRVYSARHIKEIIRQSGLCLVEQRRVCHIGVAMADALIAKLAAVFFGNTVVHQSEMAFKASSSQVLSRCYYGLWWCLFPVMAILERILPEWLGTENLITVSKVSETKAK